MRVLSMQQRRYYEPVHATAQRHRLGLRSLRRLDSGPRRDDAFPAHLLGAAEGRDCRQALARGVASSGELIPPIELGFAWRPRSGSRWPSRTSAARAPSGRSRSVDAPRGRTAALLEPRSRRSAESRVGARQPRATAGGRPASRRRTSPVEFLEARQLDDVARFPARSRRRCANAGSSSCSTTSARGHSSLDRIPLFRPGRHQGRSQPHHGHRRRLLQASRRSSASRGPLPPHPARSSSPRASRPKAKPSRRSRLGVDLLQGYYLGRPQPVSSFDNGGLSRASSPGRGNLLRKFAEPHGGRDQRAQAPASALQRHPQRDSLSDLTNANAAVFGEHPPCASLPEHPTWSSASTSSTRRRGVQVTETDLERRRGPAAPGGALCFRPAPKGTDHSRLEEYYYVPLDVEEPEVHDRPVRLARERQPVAHDQHLLPGRRQ